MKTVSNARQMIKISNQCQHTFFPTLCLCCGVWTYGIHSAVWLTSLSHCWWGCHLQHICRIAWPTPDQTAHLLCSARANFLEQDFCQDTCILNPKCRCNADSSYVSWENFHFSFYWWGETQITGDDHQYEGPEPKQQRPEWLVFAQIRETMPVDLVCKLWPLTLICTAQWHKSWEVSGLCTDMGTTTMTVIDEAFGTLWGIVLHDTEVLLKTALSAFDSIPKYRLGICTHLKKDWM